MTEATPKSFLPERFRILSGSSLKLIAIITMLIDHTAFVLLTRYPAAMEPLFYIGTNGYSLYRICRDIGRAAFPIFCFLLVEGFLHTRNRKNTVAIFWFLPVFQKSHGISCFKIPGIIKNKTSFFTLLLGYLAFCAIEQFRENERLQFLSVLLLLGISLCLNADYGWKGYIFLLIMYLLRNYKASQAIVGSCWLHYEWKACFAFLSINMYNGQRGFIKGKAAKYFFYIFYPLHITILVILRNLIF